MTLLLLLTLVSGSVAVPPAQPGERAMVFFEHAADPTADTTRVLEKRTKNPTLALALSGLNTAVPLGIGYVRSVQGGEMDRVSAALLAYGFLVGPAVGHLYAGNRAQAGKGVLVRSLGAGVAGLGLVFAIYAALEPEAALAPVLSGALGFTGGGLLLGWAVHDIRTAPRSAVRYNARRIAGHLAPQVNVAERAVGLSLRLRF